MKYLPLPSQKILSKRRNQHLQENNNEITHDAQEAAVNETQNSAPTFTPHDDFDWNTDKRAVRKYSDDERAQMENQYDKTFVTINDNEIIKGNVVSITSNDVVLNIGFKSDGLVPFSEFRDMPELKVGDVVEVLVMEKENSKGQLMLSRKNAKLMRAWDNIVTAHKTGEVVTGLVTSKTKGGLIVDLYGMETFLPGSQIDVKPITDYDQFVGQRMEFKVVKVNEAIKNAVVSHKALIESDLENQRQEIMSKLEKGQVLEGTIKNITDFGAFIDLGGVDGLLYITDISWGRINHPNEVLHLNQKLNVVVLDFDDEKKRISLGLKQLLAQPWETLDDANYHVGAKVKGKIVNIEEYGAFLEIIPGVEGLIHVSEISWSNSPVNPKDKFKLGDECEAMIVTIDKAEHKMSLSLKQLTKDPWSDIETRFPIGSRHTGKVRNTSAYGVFVELEDGITGFVHVSDLSWTKRVNHPNDFVKIGEDLEVIVLEIDKENRKLSLGHKQIEEDPWDTFESVFPVGSIHQATIMKKDDKGAVVLLPYGLEAYAPAKHLKKENGKLAEADETLEFKVLEFDRNGKKIIVSHTKVLDDKKDAERNEKFETEKKERTSTRETVKKVNKTVEKATLGDLGVLSELKSKIEQESKDERKDQDSKEETKEEESGATE
jgi:small subunit ribosomal protein S1